MDNFWIFRFLAIANVCFHYSTRANPSGIRINSVHLSELVERGCTVCHDVSSSSLTSAATIDSCLGPHLFVGARLASSDTFELGAFGAAKDVQTRTLNGDHHDSDGISWHFTSEVSFGFSSSTDVSENSARLSWNLDPSEGGQQIGNRIGKDSEDLYYKSIYNCPLGPSPESQPSSVSTEVPSLYFTELAPVKLSAEIFASPTVPSLPIAATRVELQIPNYPQQQISVDELPSGIQYGSISLTTLEAFGCTECYNVVYATPTTTTTVESCHGPNLFIGARLNSEQTFELGAFAAAADIKTHTSLNSPHLSNGVYWYLTPSKSFGFLDGTDLEQNQADTGSSNGKSRLSWHLDWTTGGSRVGERTGLDSDTNWLKTIYNCPVPGSAYPVSDTSAIHTADSSPLSAPPTSGLERGAMYGETSTAVALASYDLPPLASTSEEMQAIAPVSSNTESAQTMNVAGQSLNSQISLIGDVINDHHKPPVGIQYGVIQVGVLEKNGCTPCYDEFYSSHTTSAIIDACTGSYLFVGARLTTNDTFELGAFGLASEIKTRTELDTPHLSNGVYWYLTPGSSFGFLNSTALRQNQADTERTDGASRLSWHLDLNAGGSRVGELQYLEYDTTYRKVIYSCDVKGMTMGDMGSSTSVQMHAPEPSSASESTPSTTGTTESPSELLTATTAEASVAPPAPVLDANAQTATVPVPSVRLTVPPKFEPSRKSVNMPSFKRSQSILAAQAALPTSVSSPVSSPSASSATPNSAAPNDQTPAVSPTVQPSSYSSTNPTHEPTVPTEKPSIKISVKPTAALPKSGTPVKAPTSPTTTKPSTSPIMKPTKSPSTIKPTTLPSTKNPSTLPTTKNPSKLPTTKSPSTPPITTKPSTLPTTKNPSTLPTTKNPSTPPTTKNPSTLPTTKNPSTLPTTKPSTLPTTTKPSTLPTTKNPSTLPTTKNPSTLPTTKNPSTLPTTKNPSTPPTTKKPSSFVTSGTPARPTSQQPAPSLRPPPSTSSTPLNTPHTAVPVAEYFWKPSSGPATSSAPIWQTTFFPTALQARVSSTWQPTAGSSPACTSHITSPASTVKAKEAAKRPASLISMITPEKESADESQPSIESLIPAL